MVNKSDLINYLNQNQNLLPNADSTPLWIPYLAYDDGAVGSKVDYMQARKGADPPLGTTSSDYY